MAENPLKQLSLDELRRLAALQRSGQLPPAAVIGMGFDPQTFDTDLREALREGMRVPYEGPPGAPPVPEAPVRVSPLLPERPPSGAEIMRSIVPPAGAPPQSMGGERPYTPYVDLPVASEGMAAEAPAPAPSAPPADPYAAVRQYLGGGAGMGGIPGPTKFTMPTRPAELNEEEARRKLSVGMPGEREAQEIYKADPYMTMLQTGLRILAAEPKLGQSAISAIAGPVAQGVTEFRGEKEKERLSKREEAKEAREEAYRRFGAQRDITSKLLDIGEAAKTRDLQYQKARFDVEKGVSDEALKRQELAIKASERDLQRATLEFRMAVQEGQIPPREAFRIVQDLETKAQAIRRIPEEQRTPQQKSDLESIRFMQAAATRAAGHYFTGEARRDVAALQADTAQGRLEQMELDRIRKRMADIQNGYRQNAVDPQGYLRDPEYLGLQARLGSAAAPDMNLAPTRPSGR